MRRRGAFLALLLVLVVISGCSPFDRHSDDTLRANVEQAPMEYQGVLWFVALCLWGLTSWLNHAIDE